MNKCCFIVWLIARLLFCVALFGTTLKWKMVTEFFAFNVLHHCLKDDAAGWPSDETVKFPCKVPQIDPWNDVVSAFYKGKQDLTNMTCALNYVLMKLVWLKDGTLLPKPQLELTDRGRSLITAVEPSQISCFYFIVQRNEDDTTTSFSEKIAIKSFPFEMPEELVKVECWRNAEIVNLTGRAKPIYVDVFAGLIPKLHSSVPSRSSNMWNVIVIVIDSLSTSDAIRFLPKSYNWMAENGALIFKGYHKIGENTFPNVVPMLSGKTIETLDSIMEFQRIFMWKILKAGMRFDEFPFIWKKFSEAGYRTMFTMNEPQINMFIANGGGFQHPPTDHYGIPFFLTQAAANTHPSAESEDFCYNGHDKFETVWDYGVKQFLLRYSQASVPMFGFTWTVDLAHNNCSRLKYGDGHLLRLLKFLLDEADETAVKSKPWLDNTFIFALSDHGQRVESIRSSVIGRLEDRLPLLSFFIPKGFKQKFPKLADMAKANLERLVTVYDIYSTWKHILHLSTTLEPSGEPSFDDHGEMGFGRSLFTPIDALRSCFDAGVPSWYCACQKFTTFDSGAKEATRAAKAIVDKLNRQLGSYITNRTCTRLVFSSVKSIQRLEFSNGLRYATDKCRLLGIIKTQYLTGNFFDEYFIQVETNPFKALFEGSVRHDGERYLVVGNIERVNRYGNQSGCLSGHHKMVRKMCACTDRLTSTSY